MTRRIACIDYINARPLTEALRSPPRDVEVSWGTPFETAQLLAEGGVDAALVPVASLPEITADGSVGLLPGWCIACRGPVESVRLFSRRPWGEVTTLAADRSSRTSVELARLFFRWKGASPEVLRREPDREQMLREASAALIIGDAALGQPSADLRQVDLGEAWHRETGLPMVFALWALRRGSRQSETAGLLERAAREGTGSLEAIALRAARESGGTADDLLRYLRDRLVYRFGEEERRGLDRFFAEMVAAGRLAQPPGLPFLTGDADRAGGVEP